jgi:hypothetical protein
LTNTKCLGRYHNAYTRDNTDGNSSSQSHFNKLASLYEVRSRGSIVDWDKPLFEDKRSSLQKVLANAKKTTERATKFINKIKSRHLACANRAKSIPENAIIRKEYIKCEKQMCEIEHGPYYYAYLKDPESKKLKKKYIGDHMPSDKKSNDGIDN